MGRDRCGVAPLQPHSNPAEAEHATDAPRRDVHAARIGSSRTAARDCRLHCCEVRDPLTYGLWNVRRRVRVHGERPLTTGTGNSTHPRRATAPRHRRITCPRLVRTYYFISSRFAQRRSLRLWLRPHQTLCCVPGTAEDDAAASHARPCRAVFHVLSQTSWEVEPWRAPEVWSPHAGVCVSRRRRAGEGRESAATGSEVGGLMGGRGNGQETKGLPGPVERTGQKRGVDHASLPLADDACVRALRSVMPFLVSSHGGDEEARAKRRGRVVDSVGALTAERPVLITSSVVGKTNKGRQIKATQEKIHMPRRRSHRFFFCSE